MRNQHIFDLSWWRTWSKPSVENKAWKRIASQSINSFTEHRSNGNWNVSFLYVCFKWHLHVRWLSHLYFSVGPSPNFCNTIWTSSVHNPSFCQLHCLQQIGLRIKTHMLMGGCYFIYFEKIFLTHSSRWLILFLCMFTDQANPPSVAIGLVSFLQLWKLKSQNQRCQNSVKSMLHNNLQKTLFVLMNHSCSLHVFNKHTISFKCKS